MGRDLGEAALAALVGETPAMQALRERIRKYALPPHPVLVLGETGTGKELVAQAIHALSGRSGDLVIFNAAAAIDTLACSELFGHARGAHSTATEARPGLFEQANGGTLCLDEIGDATPALQQSVLRLVEEGEVRPLGARRPIAGDVRFVTATNVNLADRVATGRFRHDLWQRLQVLVIHLPPLRHRLDDLPALFPALATRIGWLVDGAPPLLTPDALRVLRRHPWPGNVRELLAVVRRLSVDYPDGRIDARAVADAIAEGDGCPASDMGTSGTNGTVAPPAGAGHVAHAAGTWQYRRGCHASPEKYRHFRQVIARHAGDFAAAARDLDLTEERARIAWTDLEQRFGERRGESA